MALAYFVFQGNSNVVQGLDEKRTYDDMTLDNYLMSIYDGSIYSSDDESIKETGSVTCDSVTLIE